MRTKKTVRAKATEDNKNADLYSVSRSYFSRMAEKHNVDINKLMIGMQCGDLVVQVYDEGAYPMWNTLEIVSF